MVLMGFAVGVVFGVWVHYRVTRARVNYSIHNFKTAMQAAAEFNSRAQAILDDDTPRKKSREEVERDNAMFHAVSDSYGRN